MEKMKLYQLLSAFKEEDLKAAKKFLVSPYHNTDPLVSRYFEYLQRFHPGMDSPLLKNEAAFQFLFPKKQFDEKKLRNLRHKLTQLLESFLMHDSLEKDKATSQRMLVTALSSRDAYTLFEKEVEAQVSQLEKGDNRGLDYHREMVWLQHELYFHPETERLEAYHPAIFATVKNMELYSCLAMLTYTAEMVARKRILQEDWNPGISKDILENIAKRLAPESLPIDLFLKLLHPEANQLETMVTVLEACENQLSKWELGLALKMLMNLAITRSNERDDLPSHRLVFGLYRKGIEKGLYTEKDAKNPLRFLNIAALATLAQEFDWARGFIEQHQLHLEENERNDTVCLALAHWHYHRGRQQKVANDFKVALSHLALVRHTNDVTETRVRPLQLRLLYDDLANDPSSLKPLLSYTRNFQNFLSRNTVLPTQMVENYLNFTKYLKWLIDLRKNQPPDASAVTAFMEQLANEKSIIIRKWLMEKGEELR